MLPPDNPIFLDAIKQNRGKSKVKVRMEEGVGKPDANLGNLKGTGLA